jgi:hypothetical protein
MIVQVTVDSESLSERRFSKFAEVAENATFREAASSTNVKTYDFQCFSGHSCGSAVLLNRGSAGNLQTEA